MQISVSELRKYLQCPRSFKLSEIDGIEPEYKSLSYCRGTVVKECIAILHKEKPKICDYSKQEIYELCECIWKQTIDDEKVNKDELEIIVVKAKKGTKSKPAIPAITKGQRILENIQKWVFSYSREEIDAKVLYTSIYFQTIIADMTFVGFIDLIREVNSVLEIVIFSSSSHAPSIQYQEHDFINSVFAHAVLFGKLFPKSPDVEEIIELKKLPKILIYHLPHLEDKQKQHAFDVSRSKEELLQFEYEILYTVSGIQNEFFPKFPYSVCGCDLCPYAKACKEYFIFEENHSFEAPEEERKEVI